LNTVLEQRSDHKFEFYGEGLPDVDHRELRGRLIVIEGTDGVGRSTQVSMLKPWLESNGHAVLDTGMTRSALAGKGIKQAKEGHTLGPIALTLFYATDFADRLENEMIPALRAGFIVLTDRYIYSLIARAIVRGGEPDWIKSVYGLALKPDAIFYLRAEVSDLIPRVLRQPSGFDYWESGMDIHMGEDRFDSFVRYQTRMIGVFDSMVQQYGFSVIDASHSIDWIFTNLQRRVGRLLREPH
jgi:dTMP kinase